MMRLDIICANPDIISGSLKYGLISRAIKKKIAKVILHNLRDFAEGKHRQIDDTPYGGGSGMVLNPEPFFRCIKKLKKERDYDEIIHLTPQGVVLNQTLCNAFSLKKNLMILCGHYKGIDERVIKKFVSAEISIGQYVLSCGEIAALSFTDAVLRLIPGALGNGESALTDTFQCDTGFDFPQYTRPEIYERMKVPKVLLSGNHSEIYKWRKLKAEKKFKKIYKNN